MALQQKPPDLDSRGKPIIEQPPDLDANGNPIQSDPVADAKRTLDRSNSLSDSINSIPEDKGSQEPGWLMNAWRKLTQPLTTAPSRFADDVMKFATKHGVRDPLVFGVHNAGEIASDLTSPLNIAIALASGGESVAGKAGLSTIAKVAAGAGKTLSIPTAAEGGYNLFTGDTWTDKLKGAVELGMSALPFIPKGGRKILNEVPKEHPNIGPTTDVARPNIPINSEMQSATAGKIVLKPGAGLDRAQEVVAGGYKLSHQNPDGSYVFIRDSKAPITETQIAKTRPTANAAHRQLLGPETNIQKTSNIAEALNLPRAIMASTDMSAPLRQGLPLIHKKEYWAAIPDMFRAFGSENAFQSIQETIANKPLFKRRLGPEGKVLPSFAEDAGLRLTDLHDLSHREEALMSTWAEKIPGFKHLFRASERAYTGFLNKLRADTFESLINNGKVINPEGETNLVAARGLADFVNTATGRGSLGKLERGAVVLNSTFFAPRLIASRLKMLNPMYYIMAEPQVRKEALKSLFAVTAFGNTIGQLGRMAGGTVESNPNSSDFGKVKIGNIRIDPWAGFQQYIVAANRVIRPESWHTQPNTDIDTGIVPYDLVSGMMTSPGGHMKSTISNNDYKLGSLPVGSNRFDVAERFTESKMNPLFTLAAAILRGKSITGQPVNVPEEVASRFIPIFIQDLKQLATENPNLIPNFGQFDKDSYGEFHPENLPYAALPFFGMGLQQYGPK